MLVIGPALDPLNLDGILPNNEQLWSLTHPQVFVNVIELYELVVSKKVRVLSSSFEAASGRVEALKEKPSEFLIEEEDGCKICFNLFYLALVPAFEQLRLQFH